MIKWHCSRKPMILGILSSGNSCMNNQFLYKLLETASTASDLKCLKIQVIWDHAPSNWTIWGWQKAVMMKFKHLLENVVIFWIQPQQPQWPCTYRCENYSSTGAKTIQGRKLFEEIRYLSLDNRKFDTNLTV